MGKKSPLFAAGLLLLLSALVFAGVASAVVPPYHIASTIGGISDAERTFADTGKYTFTDQVNVTGKVINDCPAFTDVVGFGDSSFCMLTSYSLGPAPDYLEDVTWVVANDQCRSFGMRLCSSTEWYAACRTGRFNFMTTQGGEWVSDIREVSLTQGAMAYVWGAGTCETRTAGWVQDAVVNLNNFRCCI